MPAEMSTKSVDQLKAELDGRIQSMLGRIRGEPPEPTEAVTAPPTQPIEAGAFPETDVSEVPEPAGRSLADMRLEAARMSLGQEI